MAPKKKTELEIHRERIKEIEQQQEKYRKQLDEQAAASRRQVAFNLASNELASFESAMMARAESWMIAARNVGSAYKMAVDSHEKTVADQNASDALSNQMLFAVLSVATVGALSWLSSAVQNRNATSLLAAETRLANAERRLAKVKSAPESSWRRQNMMIAQNHVDRLKVMPKPVGMVIEALEDVLQVAADKVLTTWAPTFVEWKVENPSEDPQVFQNEEENKVSRVKIKAFLAFSEIRAEWGKQPPEFWDTYDIEQQTKQHEEWQKEADGLAGEDRLRPIQEMADEIERGIWRRYILESHSHLDFGIFETDESYDYVGYHVVKRLEKLGVTQPLGINTESPLGAMYVETLVRWANIYQVQSLLTSQVPTP